MKEPSRHKYSRVSLGTLLVVLVIGGLGALLNPALLASPRAALADGSWSSGYQEAFTEGLYLLAPARAFWNGVDLALFGQGPAGVLTGGDGWLFTEEEYASASEPEAAQSAWLQEIAAVDAELGAAGVSLIVALVPSKAASLSGNAPPLPPAKAASYETLLQELSWLGITAVDLRGPLGSEEAWLRTDTHWTPRGAEAAAVHVAGVVREAFPGLSGTLEHEISETAEVKHEGDLARLLALGALTGRLGYPTELITTQRIMPAGSPEGGLFDEVIVPAVLVGTSYSAGEAWSLADRLRLALAADVLDASASGLGPLEPMRTYLASEAFVSGPPQVVIWEVPVRYLTRRDFLPGGAGS